MGEGGETPSPYTRNGNGPEKVGRRDIKKLLPKFFYICSKATFGNSCKASIVLTIVLDTLWGKEFNVRKVNKLPIPWPRRDQSSTRIDGTEGVCSVLFFEPQDKNQRRLRRRRRLIAAASRRHQFCSIGSRRRRRRQESVLLSVQRRRGKKGGRGGRAITIILTCGGGLFRALALVLIPPPPKKKRRRGGTPSQGLA